MQKLVETELTWGEKLRHDGKTEGIVEGEWIGKHTMLLRLMTLIFGPLPDGVEAQIKTIKDDTMLDSISRQMLVAKSLSEITLPPLPNQA